jgi:hypothetical protein
MLSQLDGIETSVWQRLPAAEPFLIKSLLGKGGWRNDSSSPRQWSRILTVWVRFEAVPTHTAPPLSAQTTPAFMD